MHSFCEKFAKFSDDVWGSVAFSGRRRFSFRALKETDRGIMGVSRRHRFQKLFRNRAVKRPRVLCGRRAAIRRARAVGPALPALPRVPDSILFLTRVSFGSEGWKSLFLKPKRNWLLLQPRRPGGRRRRPPEAVVLCYFANFPQIARKFFSAPRRPGRARLKCSY